MSGRRWERAFSCLLAVSSLACVTAPPSRTVREARVRRQRPAPGNPAEPGGGDGSIDARAVAEAVRTRLADIRQCYDHELRRSPSLEGRVVGQFTIAMDGTVTDVRWEQSEGFGEAGACIAQVLRAIAMPRPTGGPVDFSFPFSFRPAH